MLHNGLHLDPDGLNPAIEKQVTAVQRAAISALFGLGVRRVIVDDTNMNPIHLDQWYELARSLDDVGFGAKSFLDVPLKTCVERDSNRAAAVGEQVIRRMDERFGCQARTWYELVYAGLYPRVPVVEKKG
jgi:predicted kinase